MNKIIIDEQFDKSPTIKLYYSVEERSK